MSTVPDAHEIAPDEKDWTWVLQEPCDECGFDPADVAPTDVPDLVRSSLPRWEAVLRRPDVAVRPDPATWSDLEYACHVREVFTIMRERLELTLTTDDARFANWDQDATAVADRYAEQDPADVASALVVAGDRLAAAVAAVPSDAWERTATRSNGSVFTAATLVQYCWHDVAHHLVDVDAPPVG